MLSSHKALHPITPPGIVPPPHYRSTLEAIVEGVLNHIKEHHGHGRTHATGVAPEQESVFQEQ